MFLFGTCFFEHGFLALVVCKMFFITAKIIINYSYLLNLNFLQWKCFSIYDWAAPSGASACRPWNIIAKNFSLHLGMNVWGKVIVKMLLISKHLQKISQNIRITSRHLGWNNQDKPQKSHFNLKFSIFSKSFQMFPEGMESVWGCSLGLKTHFTWYQAIFKAFFEKKLKVETCLREAFCMSKTGFACKNAFSSRKTRIF